jgi:peroxiredoxin
VLSLLRPGTPAPDGELAASTGGTIRLSDCWRDAHVLLLFYPGNDTPG